MSTIPSHVLASFPLLSACGPEDIAELSQRLRSRKLDTGEAAMREGEGASDFALLVSGQLKITRGAGDQLEQLGVARPGAILGELALLRRVARTATVTADVPCEMAFGDIGDLEFLLHLPGVHEQVRDLASARLAQDVRPVSAALPDGTRLLLRPLLPSDRAAYTAAVGAMSPASLRSRFFSPGQPDRRLIDYLLLVDYVDHFVWVAVLGEDPTVGLATGRYVRPTHDADEAEIAVAVVDAYHGRGIGRLMLGAIGVTAKAAGVERLVGLVQHDNTPMRALLNKAGAHFGLVEPGVVRGELQAEAAAGLLDADLRSAIDRSSRDIVTAAGLALT